MNPGFVMKSKNSTSVGLQYRMGIKTQTEQT